MRIEDYRPAEADVELMLVSLEAAPLMVSQLVRPRARAEWRVPDMPAVRNRKGEEFTGRQWIDGRKAGDLGYETPAAGKGFDAEQGEPGWRIG